MGSTQKPDVSIAVVCWNMSRELPRTLLSLSRAFQRNVEDLTYEIVLCDNGSASLPMIPEMDPAPVLVHFPQRSKSPVGALNAALKHARGKWVGAWIDGARLASQNLLQGVYSAGQLHTNPIIAVPNWQLGPKRQAVSIEEGYSSEVEDGLLAQAGWPDPGCDLFSISSPEMSRIDAPMLESNALFLSADTWKRLDYYDPAFSEAGGGVANPDMLVRAVGLQNAQLIRLASVATFHQTHGGTTTDGTAKAIDAVKQAARNYARIRGYPLRAVRQKGWIFDVKTGQVTKDNSM
ncbi:hypothetical protein GCM10007385_40700 [Tateyamaria omphalii]|uniref:glycosyltransferase family 2 protein n=1 Tax=Tateyamaria omphalii TaxID=299262 RepID=UPI0016750348|nr:glycosyltransferase family A protein [Tateyamaria omphalii]GGX67429.1 hypothetical protein GCM10007385_40700 [Tateyamaria omphalii]